MAGVLLTRSIKPNLHNGTSFERALKAGHALRSSRTATIPKDGHYVVKSAANETYREHWIVMPPKSDKVILSSDDWDAITIYRIPNYFVSWRGTTKRALLSSRQDKAAYKALESETFARIKTVASLLSSLEMHLKHIKICHAQCEHLQTLLKDIQKMIEIFRNVSQNDFAMRKLYKSRKLRNLVSSLDNLVNSLRFAKNLLLKCGSDWRKMALVVSMPLPGAPGTKTCSEFDLLMGELRWQLGKIRYALYFGNESDVQWKWCTRTCRFELLLPNEDTDGGGVEDDACSRVNSDRKNLKQCLKDESIFAGEKLNYLLPWKWASQFALDGAREAFGTVLKQRLTTKTFETFSLALVNFKIDHLDIKCGDKLSEGSSKKIYKGKWLGQEVAIGIMGCNSEILDLVNLVKSEAGFLLKLQHPNIVACYGYSYTDDPPLPASKDGVTTAGYLVMELMEDDLMRVIEKRMKLRGPFSISVALDILLQIVEAMVHSHDHNVMHRDLKPGNCLVKSRSVPSSKLQALDVFYDVKLTDFGSTRIVDPGDAKSEKSCNRGTPRWMAPEMVRSKGIYVAEYRKSADVYGFAMICYQVITGFAPYHDVTLQPSDFIRAISEDKLQPSFPLSLSCPEGLKQLMRDCWHHKADSRPDFKEIQRRLWSIKKDEELFGI